MKEETTSAPINLLLADVRQALFDEAKRDDGAGASFRYEAGRAVGLIGHAADTITGLLDALEAQIDACFDPTCEMCARHQVLVTKARGAKS